MDQDIVAYQRKRFEGINAAAGFTQEVINSITSIIKAAMDAGQLKARVQTLHLASCQYGFSRIEPYSGEDHILYDARTLKPMQGCKTRVHFNARVMEMLQWIKAQGLGWVCATHRSKSGGLAGFVYIFVVFIPCAPSGPSGPSGPGGATGTKSPRGSAAPGGGGRASSLWNTVYMAKSFDDPSSWNERCLSAIRSGASYCAICTLYREADFMIDGGDIPLEGPMLHHLSMDPIDDRKWGLSKRFAPLVEWTKHISFGWTLSTSGGAAGAQWAYFIVLFDPLEEYY